MRGILFTLLLATTASASWLEGPNIQPGPPSLATTFVNCHPDPVGSKVFVFQRPPKVANGPGYVGVAHCQYLSDASDTFFPYLAPAGFWLVATNTCGPGTRCLCTRWQYGAQNGGGDCGEDDPGPTCTPNQPDSCPTTTAGWFGSSVAYAAPVKKPRVTTVGKCPVVAGDVEWWRCDWKAK